MQARFLRVVHLVALPFASFVPSQPPVDVTALGAAVLAANGGAPGSPVVITTTPYFADGTDPTTSTDPPIAGAATTLTVTPRDVEVTARLSAASWTLGPSAPQTYTVAVDVPDGVVTGSLNITIPLPAGLVLTGPPTASAGVVTSAPTVSGVPLDGTHVAIIVEAGNIVGTPGGPEFTLIVPFAVDCIDGSGLPWLDPESSVDAASIVFPDPRADLASSSSIVAAGPSATLESLILRAPTPAISTDVGATGVTPGDILASVFTFDVSDCVALELDIDATIADGVSYVPSPPPTLSLDGGATTSPLASGPNGLSVDISRIGNDANPATDGTTSFAYNLTDALAVLGASSAGFIPGPVTGGSLVTSVQVATTYTDSPVSGGRLAPGDTLTLASTAVFRIVNASTGAPRSPWLPGGNPGWTTSVRTTAISETALYAANDVVCYPCTSLSTLAPGSNITFSMRYTVPMGVSPSLDLVAYLPTPVFDTSVLASSPYLASAVPSALPPPLGGFQLGPFDSMYNGGIGADAVPNVTVDASNVVTFSFPYMELNTTGEYEINVLVTVAVGTTPLPDLSPFLIVTQSSSGASFSSTDLSVRFGEPELVLHKGILGVDDGTPIKAAHFAGAVPATPGLPSPDPATVRAAAANPSNACSLLSAGMAVTSGDVAASPLDTAGLVDLDAGDLVVFAIVVENVGHAHAYDVRLSDGLPADFELVAECVLASDGSAFPHTGSLFGPSGIELADSITAGALRQGRDLNSTLATDGSNIAVALVVARASNTTCPGDAPQPGAAAAVTRYSNSEGGGNFIGNVVSSLSASSGPLALRTPTAVIALVSTSLPETSGLEVTAGEMVIVELVLSPFEGTLPAMVSYFTGGGSANSVVESASLLAGPGLDHMGLTPATAAGALAGNQFGPVELFNRGDNVLNGSDVVALSAQLRVVSSLTTATFAITGVFDYKPSLAGPATDGIVFTVVAPSLTVALDVPSGFVDANDVIPVVVTIDDAVASSGPAYETLVTVTVDAKLALNSLLGGWPAANVTLVSPQIALVALGTRLPSDPPVVLTLNATVANNVNATEALALSVQLDYLSAPNASVATPYLATATGMLTVGQPEAVSIVYDGSSEATTVPPATAIGETVAFSGLIRVHEGVTSSMSLVVSSTCITTIDTAAVWFDETVLSASDAVSGTLASAGSIFLGDVTNTADNAVDTRDELVINGTLHLVDAGGNTNNDACDVVATASWVPDSGVPSSSVALFAVDVVEPILAASLTMSPSTGDAGNWVTVSASVAHVGGSRSSAHNLTLVVALPHQLELVPRSAVVSAPGAPDVQVVFFNATHVVAEVGRLDGPPAAAASLLFMSVITNSSLPASVGTATVAATYHSVSHASTRRRYEAVDSAVLSVVSPTDARMATLSTSLTETGLSQHDMTNWDLAVGETADVNTTVVLSEGTMPLTVSVDFGLAAGRVEIVHTEVIALGASISGSALSLGAAASATTTDTATYAFGTITNTGDNVLDAGDSVVVLTRVRALDVPVNVDGTAISAASTADFGSGTLVASESFDVVAPLLTFDLAQSITTGDAGDNVTFTVTVDHAGASTAAAYALNATSLFNIEYALFSGSVTTTSGTVVSGNNAGDASVHVLIPTFDLGTGPITITYVAALTDFVSPHQTTWHASALEYGTSPEAAVARTLATADNETIVVDDPYEARMATLATSLPGSGLAEHVATAWDLSIGETADVNTTVVLSEGTMPLTVSVDFGLAAGRVEIVHTEVAALGASISGSALSLGAAASATTTDTATYAFGTITNTGDNVLDAGDSVVVLTRVRALDVPVNVDGTAISAASTVDFGSSSLTASESFDVVAPLLTFDLAQSITTGDAGDNVTFTVTVDHAGASTAAAYALNATSLFNIEYALFSGSVTTTSGTVVSGNNAGDASVHVLIPTFDLGTGPITITYVAALTDFVSPHQTTWHASALEYGTSPEAAVARTLATADNETIVVDDPYEARMATLATSLPGSGLAEHVATAWDLSIGETADVNTTVVLSEGTMPLTVSVDFGLAAGRVEIVHTEVAALGASISGSALSLGAAASATTTDTATYAFGTITNTGDNVLDAGDSVVVLTRVRALDVPVNVDGTAISAASTVDFGSSSLTASESFDVVAPLLTFDLAQSITTGDAGDNVTFTVTVDHAGASTAAAYALNATSLFNIEYALFSGSVTTTSGTVVSGNNAGDASVHVLIPTFDLGTGPITITYVAALTDFVSPHQTTWHASALEYGTSPEAAVARTLATADNETIVVDDPYEARMATLSTSLTETGLSQHGMTNWDLAVGETADVNTTVVLSEGTMPLTVSVDFGLAAGRVEIVHTEVAALGASISGSALSLGAAASATTTDTATYAFGTITNTGDNVLDAGDSVVVLTRVRALDVPVNVDGTAISAASTVDFGSSSLTASESFDVVAPLLTFDLAQSITTGDAGDNVTFTVTVDHAGASTAAAYALNATSLFNIEYALFSGSVTTTSGTVVSGNNAGDASVHVLIPTFDLGTGPITITYVAALTDFVSPHQTTWHASALEYGTSPEAAVARTLATADNETIVVDDPYEARMATLSTSLTETGLSQHDMTNWDLAVGETADVNTTVVLSEGTMPLTVSVDFGLAAGRVEIVHTEVAALGASISGSALTSTVDFGSGTLVASESFDVVAPLLTFDLAQSITTGDAGDNVTFTVTVDHAGASTAAAYALNATSLFNIEYALFSGSVTTTSGTVVSGNNAGDASVHVLIPTFDLGTGPITITYVAALTDFVSPHQTTWHASALEYDTSPEAAVARTLAAADNETIVVDDPYEARMATLSTSLTETGLSQHGMINWDLAVGETADVNTTVVLSEGTMPLTVSVDFGLAAGRVEIVHTEVAALGASISGSALSLGAAASATTTDTATYAFGTITNTGDNVLDAGDVVVVLTRVRALDVPVNVDGTAISAASTVDFGSGTLVASESFDVVAPLLTFDLAQSITTGDAGDNVTFTVTVDHAGASTAAAYALNATSLFNIEYALFSGSVTTTSGTVVSGNNAGDASVHVLIPTFDLGTGPITITYVAALTDFVSPHQTTWHASALEYGTSPEAAVARTLAAADNETIVVDDPYEARMATLSTSLTETGLSQHGMTNWDLAVGETADVNTTVVLSEGTMPLTVSVDFGLAAGRVEIVHTEVAALGASISGSALSLGAAASATTTDTATYAFGTITNTGDNVLDAGDVVVVLTRVRALDVPVNVDGTAISAASTVDFGSCTLVASESFDVVAPPPHVRLAQSITTADNETIVVDDPYEARMATLATSLPGSGLAEHVATAWDLSIGETADVNTTVVLSEGTMPLTVSVDFGLAAGRVEIVHTEVAALGASISGSALSLGAAASATTTDTATYAFGTITNTGDNVLDAGDSVVVLTRVRALDVPVNVDGTAISAASTVDFGSSSLTASESFDVVAPLLTFDLAQSITTGDAGDNVTFTVTVDHAGASTAAAYALNATSLFNIEYALFSGSVTTTSGTVVSGNNAGDASVHVLIPTFDLGTGPITITYVAALTDFVSPHQTTWHASALEYDTSPEAAVARTLAAADNETIVVDDPYEARMATLATSLPESGTAQYVSTNWDLAVGETADINTTVVLSEGTLPLTVDVTVDIGALVVETEVMVVGYSLSGSSLSAGDIATSFGASSATFDFGTVINTGDNVVDDGDIVVMRIRVLIVDIVAITPGSMISTVATANYGTGLLVAQETFDMVQPALLYNVAQAITTGDAGDNVTFTITVDHAGASTAAAYALNATSLFNIEYALFSGSVTTTSGTVVSGNNAGDASVHVLIPTFDLGTGPITITYVAALTDFVSPHQTTWHASALEYDTSPEAAVARTLAAADNETIVVDDPYEARMATLSTSLTETGLSQHDMTNWDLAVGETADVNTTVVLSEGTMPLTISVDFGLAAGRVEIVHTEVAALGASISGSALSLGAAASATTTDTATYAFGTITNTGDNVLDAGDSVVVLTRVRALDVPVNVDGTAISAASTVDFGSSSLTASESFDVVAPLLTFDLAQSITTGDAGDNVTFTVTVDHAGASTAAAYALNATSLFNIEYALFSGSITTTSGTVVSGNNAGDASVHVLIPTFDLGTGPITITYVAALTDFVSPHQTTWHASALEYGTSPEAAVARTLAAADNETIVVDDPYEARMATLATSLPESGTAEHVATAWDLSIGETADVNTTVVLSEGTMPLTVSVDFGLAAGRVEIVHTEVAALGASISGSVLSLGAAASATTTDTATYAFGTITNTGDNVLGAGDVVVVLTRVRALDVPVNVDATVISAASTVDFGSSSLTASESFDVVAPLLTFDLAQSITTGDAGDNVTFTVTVDHAGASTAAAYALNATSLFNIEYALFSGSVTTTSGTVVSGNNAGDASVHVLIPTFDLGTGPITITYVAALTDFVSPHQTTWHASALEYGTSPEAAVARTLAAADNETIVVDDPYEARMATLATSLPGSGLAEHVATAWDLHAAGRVEIVHTEVTALGASISGSVLSLGAAASATTTDTATYAFGTITNTGDNVLDAGDVVVVLTRVRALDVPVNIDDTAISAASTVDFGSGTLVASESFDVVAPLLTFDLAQSITTGDAGDNVTFTISVDHAEISTAASYLVNISVALPPTQLVLDPLSVVASTGLVSLTPTSLLVSIPSFALTFGRHTIVYTAVISDAATPLQNITHVAVLDYASSARGDRRYTVSDAVSVSVDPLAANATLAVAATSVADVREPVRLVGERVFFNLTATLPEGSMSFALVLSASDAAPLIFVAASVSRVGHSLAPTSLLASGDLPTAASDHDLLFDFGVVTNIGDNVVNDDDRVVLAIEAYVPDNIAAANSGAGWLNATAHFGSVVRSLQNDFVVADSPAVDLHVATNVTAGADGNDAVAFTVTVDNNHPLASAPLFGFNLSIPMDDGLFEYVPGTFASSLADVALVAPSLPSVLVFATSHDTALAYGSSLNISFVLRLTSSVTPLANISRELRALWTSVPRLDHPAHRTHSATVVSPIVPVAAHGLAFNLSSSSFAETWPDSTLAIGENFVLTATFDLAESTTNLTFVVHAPSGVALLGAAVRSIGSGVFSPVLVPGSSPSQLSDSTAAFVFGHLVVAGDTAATSIVIDIFAAVNADSAVLLPGATVVGEILSEQHVAVALDLTFVQPLLELSPLACSPAVYDAGDVITCSVDIAHALGSSAPATNITLYSPSIDTLDFSPHGATALDLALDLPLTLVEAVRTVVFSATATMATSPGLNVSIPLAANYSSVPLPAPAARIAVADAPAHVRTFSLAPQPT
ncbi:uncharacterized protein AMSG_11683 [Thecamonas trahens ATCC 50062]|uniref:Uncharacterized protein n=1 Tax=Thecamonas trahens ATCC 50062 TaxID=461836 RepID=A0A0L0DWU1_THETB|nr:hypothetical protein AMSG_11683 [Thecamonas trahens ATCC 50062]KNC56008.1 hypothetical protein AMSG_11683 [Thecamonas trahens ATCC 50062]|eukprot:XP_013761222.1 hypothetical protein AMSG_11683 [Thecamonas trahens ATCC 50062]